VGLFDALVGKAAAALSDLGKDDHPGLLDEAARLIGGNAATGNKDFLSLLAQFKSKGLEAAVESWIGVGENRKISAQQLQSALGSEQIAAIAQRLGMSPAETSSALAKLLPQVVDHLTPGGQLPSGDMVQQVVAQTRTLK
jgi:uncharacterized protein YidB (DUF937 family)